MNYFERIRGIWTSVSLYDGPHAYLHDISALTRRQAHGFAIHWLDHEIACGGLHQFFANSAGMVAPEALKGLHAMGEEGLFVVVHEAVAGFGRPYPRDREERAVMLGRMCSPGKERWKWDPFHRLDRRWRRSRSHLARNLEWYLKQPEPAHPGRH